MSDGVVEVMWIVEVVTLAMVDWISELIIGVVVSLLVSISDDTVADTADVDAVMVVLVVVVSEVVDHDLTVDAA